MSRILVVDDDEVTRKNLSRLLEKEGHETTAAGSSAQALAALRRAPFDLVLTDLVMEGDTGMDLLEKAKALDPDVEVILVTGHASIPSAIEAVRKGAFHYLEKPFRAGEVRHLALQALEKRALRQKVRDLEARLAPDDGPDLIGGSRALVDVKEIISQVAPTGCNVLFSGESGTGKELAASLLHRQSRRRKGPFLAVNCGAFSEELLANELFGHEKDAFTGATTQKKGLLEAASGGTLFLDEVGDMPPAMQVRLLRAIQEREILRVGGTRPVPVDVRIAAATNQDLKKAMAAGLFRQDLYFRLNVVSVILPPLRERRDDIGLLANHFLARAKKKTGKDVRGISPEAMRVLSGYAFPGNVRELENIIERAVALSREADILVADLPPDLSDMELFAFTSAGDSVRTLKEVERDYIQWVLDRCGRNKTRAARLLGMDRASLWRRLKREQIDG